MTVVETVLVFLGIPLAVVVIVAVMVYGRSAVHQPNRYRPGRAWTYPAAWYLPHPQAIDDIAGHGASGDHTPVGAVEGATPDAVVAVGGANGEW